MNHGPGRQEGRDGVVLVVAVALGAALMFAFHAAAGRLLDPGDYSGLGALVSVLAVLGVPLTAVQIAVARETAAVSSAPLDAIRGVMTPAAVAAMASGRRALLGASIGATAVGATGVVASPLVAAYLHLPDAVPVVVACGWVALNGPAAVARGLLIGARRPRPVAGAIVVTGLGRLAAVA
ncbi:MAG: hypothetical protein S0880_06965, partial [Actinomycetota bacterium]|nr:hypothetical protein [Actinomycetota bacterium]